MFCPNCGSSLEDGAVFCPNCGAKIENEQPKSQENAAPVQEETVTKNTNEQGMGTTAQPGPDESKKSDAKKNVKGIIGIVAAIVVVILVVKLFAGLFGGKPDTLVVVHDEDKNIVYLNGTKKIKSFDESVSIYTNAKHTVFYALSDETAYILKGNKFKKVMDDCESITVAANSKTAMLIDEDGVLSRYDGSKLTEITDDEVSSVLVSGDGKTFAYVSDGTTYVGKKAGKEEKVKDVSIVAISENGKYMYGYKSEDSDEDDYYGYDYYSSGTLVNVTPKGDVEKIEKDVTSIVGLNESGTEIMFVHDGNTYVSVKGKEPKKVSGKTFNSVYYKNDGSTETCGYVYPIKSFKNTVAYADSALFKINGKYEAEKLIKGIYTLVGVDSDLSKVYFIDDDDTLYFAKLKKDAKAKEIEKDVLAASTDKDCNVVYYANDDEELCFAKGSSKGKEVKGIDYDDMEELVVIDGHAYINDGDDWYYANGTKTTKIKVDNLSYDKQAEEVYGYTDDAVYKVNGKSLKEVKGDFDEVSYIEIASNSYSYY